MKKDSVIGTCYNCKHRESLGDTWLECYERGRVNRTFARQYHDCYVPRTVEPEDYDY